MEKMIANFQNGLDIVCYHTKFGKDRTKPILVARWHRNFHQTAIENCKKKLRSAPHFV